MVGKATYAAGALVAGAVGLGLGLLLLQRKSPSTPPPSGCASPPTGASDRCSGPPVGVARINVLPQNIPTSAPWIPTVNCAYNICPTSDYKGVPSLPGPSSLGAVTVTSLSTGASATWLLTLSNLGDWVALDLQEVGGKLTWPIYILTK